jgi:hypothetical protein
VARPRISTCQTSSHTSIPRLCEYPNQAAKTEDWHGCKLHALHLRICQCLDGELNRLVITESELKRAEQQSR